MNVRKVRVGDVVRLVRRPVEVDPAQTYRQIGVRSFGRGIFHKDPVPGSTLGTKRIFEVASGDLVLNNVFAWEGAIAVAGEDDAGRVGSHRFLTYQAVPGQVDARYLKSFFLSEGGLRLIQRISPGAAGRNRTLGIEAFEDLTIPLPHIDEQRRIVARMDTLHAASAHLEAATAAQRRHVEVLLEKLLADVPREVPLGDLLEQDVDLVEVTPDQQFRIAGVYGFGRGLFARGPIAGAETKYRRLHRLRAGQVVLSRMQAYEGAVAVVLPEFDGWVLSPEYPTFKRRPGVVDAGYLEMPCGWPELGRRLQSMSRGVTARGKRVSADAFLSVRVPLPDGSVQERLGRIYLTIRRVRSLQERRTSLLDALTRSTLNQAFAGLA